jgi:hypothetical protein
VVVADLNADGTGIRPDEAYPPLIIDADAVLPVPISLQSLKPVAGRHAKIDKRRRGVQIIQLPQRNRGDVAKPPTCTSRISASVSRHRKDWIAIPATPVTCDVIDQAVMGDGA